MPRPRPFLAPLALGLLAALPAAAEPSPAELLARMTQMERRIQQLEQQLRQAGRSAPAPRQQAAAQPAPAPLPPAAPASPIALPSARPLVAETPAPAAPPATAAAANLPADAGTDRALFGMVDSPVNGLRLGAYGEMLFGAQQNPAARGHWQNGFDARRMVLLPSFQITDDIVFNAEIEFEHAGIGFDNDDKISGTAEVEQLYIDFRFSDRLRWRAPGIDLVPVGYTNQHHEPTLFYSVFRPELANGIVPTTWSAPATSLYGRLAEGLGYQLQLSSSLEDYGDSFSGRTDANRVPAYPTGYAAGFDGLNALNNGKPVRGDFRQLSNTMAAALRLDYAPPAIPGLAGSASLYYTPNTTPRGAYADATGQRLGNSSLALWDLEFRYRIPNSGFEFRGEYAHVRFGNPANLRANNDGDPTNNLGRQMFGVSGEAAYHVALDDLIGKPWEAVPFYRYTWERRQTAGFAGTDANTPTGAGRLQFHTMGVAVFPTRQLVLKLNYRHVVSGQQGGARADALLGGVGFFF